MQTHPLSSCNCYNCDTNKIKLDDTGVPTNLSVTDCKIQKEFNCADRANFYTGIEPTNTEGINYINPQAISEKYSRNFHKISCKNDFQCPDTQYIANDPRLRQGATLQTLTLDEPPITSSMKLSEVPIQKRLNGYGQNYKTYSDINAGQILYYTDKTHEPFYPPVFVAPAETTRTLFKDPMGAMKPEYVRYPVFNTNPVGPPRDVYEDGLSFLQDTNAHREDIISKQMAVRNQELWEPRWQISSSRKEAPNNC